MIYTSPSNSPPKLASDALVRRGSSRKPTNRRALPPWLRLVAAFVLFALAAIVPKQTWAADTGQTGAQLLAAQLPGGTTVSQANCEQLAQALTRATLAHRSEAKLILTAALTRDAKKDPHGTETRPSCVCVSCLLRASIGAAPTKASTLLELASSLYPDCADALEAAIQVREDKNVIDDKNGPAAGRTPANGSQPYSNAPDAFDPTLETSGFGVGFGPGFPGSPGFTGSPPSGAIALPPIASPRDQRAKRLALRLALILAKAGFVHQVNAEYHLHYLPDLPLRPRRSMKN